MDNPREKLIDVFMHIGDHIRSLDEYGFCIDSALAKAIEDVVGMLKNQDVHSKWIPVTERLPKIGECVLCYRSGSVHIGEYLGASYSPEVAAFKRRDGYYAIGATHWMPLPEPPKEE